MEKRPLVIVKGKTIEVFLPDGFNLVVNGEAMMGNALPENAQLSSPQDYMSGMPPGSEPQVIVVPQTEADKLEVDSRMRGNDILKVAPHYLVGTKVPSGTFFEVFEKLRLKVPRSGLQCINNENSPYCQYTEESKNCYMTFASYYSEDCMYNTRVLYCRDCMDNSFLTKCELCYECVDCTKCYNSSYSILCENAIDCNFCQFCRDTQNCFGCVGLQKKSFHIFNKSYSKEDYALEVAALKKLPHQEILNKMEGLLTSVPRPAFYGRNNEDSNGDKIFNCKNVTAGFDSENLHDAANVYHCADSKDLYDCSNLGWSELCYEIMSGGKLVDCRFCFGCWNSNNLEYCELVYNSHDCFGCVGMNHAEYSIFNQKYSKDEYFKKVAEIKEKMKKEGEYGKWFGTTYEEVLTAGL